MEKFPVILPYYSRLIVTFARVYIHYTTFLLKWMIPNHENGQKAFICFTCGGIPNIESRQQTHSSDKNML